VKSGISANRLYGFERFNLQNRSCGGGTRGRGSADDLGRLEEEGWRNGQAQGLGCFEMDHPLEGHRLLDRQIGRLGALQDLIHVGGGGWCPYATSKANEIFESPLPERRVSDTRPGNTHTCLIPREDMSARRPRPLRKDTGSRSIGRA
jgi:hypothetical protein